MDPNAHDSLPQAEIVAVEADFSELKGREPVDTPLSSSIFRSIRPPAPELTPEQIRAQHEEEFQRRLRGEYEASPERIGNVVAANMDRPLRLAAIRFAPQPTTTRAGFLNGLTTPFLAPRSFALPAFMNPAPLADAPQTLQEVLITTKAFVEHLRRFQIFDENVTVELRPKRGGDEGEVELCVGLREVKRKQLYTGASASTDESEVTVKGRLLNVFGGAEYLDGSVTKGNKTRAAFNVALTTPVFASPLLSFTASAFSHSRNHSVFASHIEENIGGRALLSAIAPWGTHDLSYDYVNRAYDKLDKDASASIRQMAFPTTKSSLTHTWTKDTRDRAFLGSSGSLLKMTHEYAGLPGSSPSAHFFKSTAQSQLSRAVFGDSGCFLSITSLTTLLIPLSPRSKLSPTSVGEPQATYLPDRTYLGGPNSVRGYSVGGIGARDGKDSLGGDLAFALGVSMHTPVPFKQHWPVKLHGFMNTGRVVAWDGAGDFASNIANLYSKPNVSAGVGLSCSLSNLRLDFNFALPLVGRRSDRMSRGFGIGFGIEFL